MSELHEVSALPVGGAFDLFQPDAEPFFQWVRPTLEGASTQEVVTGTASRAELPALWAALDEGYRVSQGYYHLASRVVLQRGARRIALRAPEIEPEALYDGITVYTHASAERVGSFLALLRRGESVLRADELASRRELDRAIDRLRAADPKCALLGVEVCARIFWHIHM